jgi:hypothetical protein
MYVLYMYVYVCVCICKYFLKPAPSLVSDVAQMAAGHYHNGENIYNVCVCGVCMHVWMDLCMYGSMCVCMESSLASGACMHVCMYVCMYIVMELISIASR